MVVRLVTEYRREGATHPPGAVLDLGLSEARTLIEDGAAIPVRFTMLARETRAG